MSRVRLTSIVACVLGILLLASGPAGAVSTWSAPIPLTGHSNAASNHPLASTGPLSAVAAYDVESAGEQVVRARTTVDGGFHWAPAVTVSAAGGGYARFPSVAAHGQDVVVLFGQGAHCGPYDPGHGPCPLFVVHSGNGGTSFGLPVKVGSMSVAGPSSVATDGAHVLVIWIDEGTDKVKTRTSVDHGATFGATHVIGVPSGFADSADAGIAAGVMYVVYDNTYAQGHAAMLRFRRSTDLGDSWSPARDFAAQANFAFLLAVGHTVLVTYVTGSTNGPHLVRSTNAGVTWDNAIRLSPATAPDAWVAWLAFDGTRYRTVFERCTTQACHHQGHIYMRTSTNGHSWTPVNDAGVGFPAGLAAGQTVIVGDFAGAVVSTQQFRVRVGH